MKALVLIVLNLLLVGLLVFLFTRRRLLTYHQDRRLWLTWLAVGVWFLNLERLPRMFPEFGFIIRYTTRVPLPSPQVNPEETTVAKPQKKTDQP